ncbi:MAG: ABC transporter ATP-binding protein [Reyranellaceae bacterium]
MLTCKGINTFYGPAHVLFDVDVEVGEGQMVCLIGRNGVGKSTTLKSIMGLAPVSGGSIVFQGREISALPSFKVARAGIGYVPEERRIFADLTVEENLEVAERGGAPWTRNSVYELFPALHEFRTRRGGLLSGGQQQMLTIARTLVGNPRLLLIDEPTEGLSPIVVRALEDMIRGLKAKGQTMLLAGQDIRFSLSVADFIYVLDRGRVVYSGDRQQAARDIERIRGMLAV